MTPQQIEDAARRKYNSVGSTFYAQAEIWDLIYQAECELALATKMLEGSAVVSGGTVASQQAYAYPTGILEIKRLTVDGVVLNKIDFRDDDIYTLLDADATTTGDAQNYFDWQSTIYLRPLPSTSSLVIKAWGYKEPALVTSASQTLEVPAIWHMSLVDRVVAELCAKDKQWDSAKTYFEIWYEKHIPAAKAWTRKRRTGDKFNVVKDEASLVGTFWGVT